jgi:hypothetical protein
LGGLLVRPPCYNSIIKRKDKLMLSTATAIIDAVSDSMMEDETMDLARFITQKRHDLSDDEFAKAIYLYSGVLSSNTADRVTKILLSPTEIAELMMSIDELEQMRNEILGEGNN